jgi:hypothetical protein
MTSNDDCTPDKDEATAGGDFVSTETAADLIPDNKQASWLVRISIKNPFLVIVLCLLICVLGYVTIGKIPVDILPSFKTPAVQVLTLYPGMPTEIMERDITSRIERWTSQSEGIERQESRSMMGVSIVKDYFRDDIDPNTAFSQVTSYAMSDMYYLPPGTVPPMVMLFDPSAPLPTALLAASSDVLDEKESYDLAYYNVRNMLSGSPGVIAPAVFGGKLRRIYIYLDPKKLESYGLSLMDVQQAIKKNNLMIPTGTAKIGETDYMVDMANMIEDVPGFDEIVVKVVDGRPIYVRDVGHVEDASAIQTNVVRISRAPNFKSQRQVYVPIFRRPGANTIDVVNGVRERIPEFLWTVAAKGGLHRPGHGRASVGFEFGCCGRPVCIRPESDQQFDEGRHTRRGAGIVDGAAVHWKFSFHADYRIGDSALGTGCDHRPLFHRQHAQCYDVGWIGAGHGTTGRRPAD